MKSSRKKKNSILKPLQAKLADNYVRERESPQILIYRYLQLLMFDVILQSVKEIE